MNLPLAAFSDEAIGLMKTSGLATSLAKTVAKNPMRALGAGFVVIPAVGAGVAGAKRGRAMGKPARYLMASRNGPSRSFYTNFNPLLSRKKMTELQRQRLHENYNRETHRT